MPYVNGTYYKTQKEGLKAEREKRGSGSSGSSSGSSISSSSPRSPSADSGVSSTRPSSGGSSYTPSSPYSGGSAASRDYHQEAKDAAARGDWSAVTRALAARQEKINAQGGNDRGTSNAQILANLQSQYKPSYSALPSTARDTLDRAASGQLNSKGWESGVDYLAQAQDYARAGDMEAAYDALRRRGFKMADTGSSGGGTSQDQAYALIQKLYDHSGGAASSYQSQLAENQRRLQEHPTIFGSGTNPSLAGKHFTSADGKYIIYYDSSGTPFKAQPNNGQYGSTKYTPEYRDLMERYYQGSDDYADLRRQMHNLDAAYSGNGRLIDQNWNWASGEALPSRDAYQYWTDFDNDVDMYRNTGQDKDVLANILARVNRGENFSSPEQAPISRAYMESLDDLPIAGRKASGGSGSPFGGGGNGLTDYGGSDLTQYIRDMYQQSLQAQLAALQAGYEQNAAGIRAQDARIAQAYQQQRNQAAGQSDLQRMYMAELGNYQGLNTGATGQMALAQNMALQNNLASLGAAENQDLAANGLALSQLGAGYQGNVNSAIAQSNSQMAGALYDELVRQVQAAQAQANWEAQFNYQMQQDAAAQEYQRQAAEWEYRQQLAQLEAAANKQGASNAWDWAQLMFKNGVMPDAGTLDILGMDPSAAQSLADSYKWQLGQKYAPKKSSGSSGGSYPKSGTSGGNYNALFQAAADSGFPDSFIPNNYKKYGFSSSSGLVDDYWNWDGDQIHDLKDSEVGAVVQGFLTDLRKGYASRQDQVDAIERAYNNQSTNPWMSADEYAWLMKKIGVS